MSLAVFMTVVFSANAATKVTLIVEKTGKGTITSSDGKINCGTVCRVVAYSGGSIDLYATPAKDFTFDKWTGNACGDAVGTGISTSTSGAMGMCQVSLYYNSNKTIKAVAHFKKFPEQDLLHQNPNRQVQEVPNHLRPANHQPLQLIPIRLKLINPAKVMFLTEAILLAEQNAKINIGPEQK